MEEGLNYELVTEVNIDSGKDKDWVELSASAENDRQEIINKAAALPNNIWINLLVLGAAVLIIELFFFYISTYINSKAFRGLWIMAGVLILRTGMEFLMFKMRGLPKDEAMPLYRERLVRYYKTRKYMHFIVAPLLLAAYIYGFVMLLSGFQQEQVGAHYGWIIYLSWFVFLGLAVLIGLQLKKELEILKLLIADNKFS